MHLLKSVSPAFVGLALLAGSAVPASAHSMFGHPPQPGVNVCDEMQPGPHILMARPAVQPGDQARAAALVSTAQAATSQYTNVQAAQADGYAYDGPTIPANLESQMCYHFTNPTNAYNEQIGFDPTQPTSLLYAKVNGQYQLQGVMYTAPLSMGPSEIDARVPASVWPWHQHVDVCEQTPGNFTAAGPNDLFGLTGSIQTKPDCAAAGGTFKPHIFAWMDHVLFPGTVGQPAF